MANPDIILELNSQKCKLFLADGINSIQDSSIEESTFNARFSRGKKKYGEDPLLTLNEWRDWTGGRGNRNVEDDTTAYYDGLAWTLTPGTIVPPPRWQIATGLRTENRFMPGDTSWKQLISANRYESVPFTSSAAYSAAHIWLFVRRNGSPGTLTVSLYTDVAGKPGVPLKTVTKTIADITDYIDMFVDFAHATPYSMASTTAYHIVVSGDQYDNPDNCWMIGIDRMTPGSNVSFDGSTWIAETFKMYYRVTDAHVSKKFLFQGGPNNFTATSRPVGGTSAFYLFDNISAFTLSHTFTASKLITGRPIVTGGKMYFPIGEFDDIVTFDLGSTWSTDSGNKATMLQHFDDEADGPQLVKINNSTDITVAFGNVPASPISFGTAIKCGHAQWPITNTVVHTNKLYVFKGNQIGIIAGDKYSLQESNLKYTASSRNGAAVCSWNGLLYFSWLNTLMEGYNGTSNDVGQAWRGQGMNSDRAGYISCMLGVNAWRICGFDAGATGYSCVQIFNGTTWHEIYRAPLGHAIRDIYWQDVDGGHSRLFIDIDYDVVYLEFPKDVANPTKDSTHHFAPTFYVTSATFDDGAARLPKYLKSVTVSTTNCGRVRDTIIYFEVDYQTDNDVGMEGAQYWHRLGRVFTSPEGTLPIRLGNKRCIRFRVRGYTDSSVVPPQVDAITLDGFTRTPFRKMWTIRIRCTLKDGKKTLQFLQEAAGSASDIICTSIVPELNGRHVIITVPRVSREQLNVPKQLWGGTMVLSITDMSE